MSMSPDPEPPLSPHRAFVVQLREDHMMPRDHFTGRVEHVTSGRGTRFGSVDEMLAFIGWVLAQQRETSPASLIQRGQE